MQRPPFPRIPAGFPTHVKVVEVGPRDGLQNERQHVPTSIKVDLINRLGRSGLSAIESASFVSPKWVPQMADGHAVMQNIDRVPGITYSALTPNMKGFEGAMQAGVDEVVIFGAASEAFSNRNINCSIQESIQRFEPVALAAKAAGMRLRASVSCALGCPYQGEVRPAAVRDVVARFANLGCDEIDIADTIGVGTPRQVQEVMDAAASAFRLDRLAGHFHDTYGQALANILASLEVGVSTFHSSVAGLGGCPYAAGATGNVATEDLIYLLHGLGIETGIKLDTLVEAGAFISDALGRPNASRVGRALLAKHTNLCGTSD
ncbi:hydroxymethylglutaryl-CoA lyase [Cupriavidus necator]|uniref:hydroxymethylglutaryl-CoA lyase n=1 Tax=Cupriavidus necator TaxID=106590 RepID=UPI003ED12C6E